jgi:hypothetical protein
MTCGLDSGGVRSGWPRGERLFVRCQTQRKGTEKKKAYRIIVNNFRFELIIIFTCGNKHIILKLNYHFC